MEIRNWWKEREEFWREKLAEAIKANDVEGSTKAAGKIEYCVSMRLEANKTAMPYAHRRLFGEKPRDEDDKKGPPVLTLTAIEQAV